MEPEKIKSLFENFLNEYELDSQNRIWEIQSNTFNTFWKERIINKSSRELADQEIDEIVKILDKKGKGNTKKDQAIGLIMIPQGAWRRMFNELKEHEKLSGLINEIFLEENSKNKALLIDKLYEINKGKKNNLTGQSGNAINCLIAVNNPFNNLSIVSLKDRFKLLKFFNNNNLKDYDSLTTGEKITKTNDDIKKVFEQLGILHNCRTISIFCYSEIFKPLWRDYKDIIETNGDIDIDEEILEEDIESTDVYSDKRALFYMENQLEDFLIKNWDKTELGKKYELIDEKGDLKSQQYRTPIGNIDILVKEKKSGNYVVIELKKDQTSDKTVGQLLRYMGWVDEHLAEGKECKGIIIAAYFDEKMHYAVRRVPGVEVFSYKIEFKLEEFK